MKVSETIHLLQQYIEEYGDHELEIQVEEPGESDEMLCIATVIEVDTHEDEETPPTAVLVAKASGMSIFWENTYVPGESP
jgi:hypothetical protein